ncbi:MAG: prepilin-type N-terminal cleavage/methylation domain-containing protein [Phycisphaerales bacterium]|nr:prepilin-type N-terminal cleavage/methylation domain-containing protein [Phycisphaerales bacterium]
MKRRGMTILELLLALALLGVLCSLLTSWLVTVARLSAERGPRLEWRSAAMRVLDGIGDDLACGDFEATARNAKLRPRVEAQEPARLRIRTRSTSTQSPDNAGPGIHEYRFDRTAQSLAVAITSTARSTSPVNRQLLSGVADWQVQLDEEDRVLSVTIVSRHGDTLSRRFTWP